MSPALTSINEMVGAYYQSNRDMQHRLTTFPGNNFGGRRCYSRHAKLRMLVRPSQRINSHHARS